MRESIEVYHCMKDPGNLPPLENKEFLPSTYSTEFEFNMEIYTECGMYFKCSWDLLLKSQW